jgi:PncC family amidohydrolase
MNQETKDIVKKVHELFRGREYTLSTAESCTGGLISHYITTLPGASNFFKGAVVSYSEEMKRDILGVSPEILHKYGVVSRETAQEMAEKILHFIHR